MSPICHPSSGSRSPLSGQSAIPVRNSTLWPTAGAWTAALCALTAVSPAQCPEAWLTGQGIPGTNGPVYATTTWDPDGTGPAARQLVFGGRLTAAGDSLIRDVGTWDPATGVFGPIGNGFGTGSETRALATLPNGQLLAGGVGTIARFDGTTWIPFQGTIHSANGGTGTCYALATMANGDVIAGGDFTLLTNPGGGGVNAAYVARWNGSVWSAIGGGLNGTVLGMLVLPNGDLVVTGTFTTAGGVAANRVARWNGTTWSALGAGLNGNGWALALLPNGDLVVGGQFTTAGGSPASYVASWNGATWAPLGSGCGWYVYALCPLATGGLAAGGAFATAGGQAAGRFAIWNGAAWTNAPAVTGSSTINTLVQLPSGDIAAGGSFGALGGLEVDNLARWDGGQWHALAGGMNKRIFALAAAANGDLIAAGDFTTAGRAGAYVAANRIARCDGTAWHPLGSGLNGAGRAVVALPNNQLVVGGEFTTAGGTVVNRIARWDGSAWASLGGGMNGAVTALVTLGNGELVAGGSFTTAGGVAANRIARWNGTAWQPLGVGVNGQVYAIVQMANGDLLVGGSFTMAGGAQASCIARWNGASWAPLSNAWFVYNGYLATVSAMLLMPNGEVVVGGGFETIGAVVCNHIARWNGSAWSSLAGGVTGTNAAAVGALSQLPSGDIVAGGSFAWAGGVAADNLARWSGSAWAPIGNGTGGLITDDYAEVRCLLATGDGALHLGGGFTGAGGAPGVRNVAKHLARVTSTCPALSQSIGAACPSSGGANTLTASALPWIGSTFRAVGTGLPTTAFVFGVTSLTPVPGVPLASVLPQGQPGCSLWMAPESLQAIVCQTGTAESSIDLPHTAALVSIVFYHQMVSMEIDSSLQLLALTASNGLRLTIGAF